MEDSTGSLHTSIVMVKTPIKSTTLGTLWSCTDTVPMQKRSKTFAWTDSTIVLNWLQGNPHRFNSAQLRPGSGTDKINFIHCQHFM